MGSSTERSTRATGASRPPLPAELPLIQRLEDPAPVAGRGAGGAPAVAVVVPTVCATDELERCLEALTVLDPPAHEVIVAVDGGDPGARAVAEAHGFRTVATPRTAGPAGARNLGAGATTAQVVLFVDSDVVVPATVVDRVGALFSAHPDVAALFGSYAARTPAPGLVARFKNLLHHFMHQHGSPDACTFWTGCGAIRRDVFLAVGGFDPHQRWLEDVELGYRLRAAGHRILLDRTLMVTHLKRWSLTGLIRSDIAHRAWPWTELIHRYHVLPNDLNLGTTGRLSGATAAALAAALAATPWHSQALWVAATAAIVLLALNARLYRLFVRSWGPIFAVGAIPLHWLYLLYGVVTFGVATAWWWVRRPLEAAKPAPQGARDSERRRAE